MSIAVITPPGQVVTLDLAKRYLRVEYADDDDLLTSLIAAAQGQIDGPDGWLGRAIGLQTLETTGVCADRGGWIALPYPPLVDIVSVTYGAGTVLAPSGYTIELGALRPTTGQQWPWGWSDLRGVTVRYRAGYAPTEADPPVSTVPAPIKAALLLMVADLYGNRSGRVPGSLVDNPAIDRLLAPFRVFSL